MKPFLSLLMLKLMNTLALNNNGTIILNKRNKEDKLEGKCFKKLRIRYQLD